MARSFLRCVRVLVLLFDILVRSHSYGLAVRGTNCTTSVYGYTMHRPAQNGPRTDLPGILLCFATNPALLKGMIQIAEGLLFGESLLSRRHKEMIPTFVSLQNACPYCAESHAVLLGAQGGSPEMICALQHGDLNAQLFTNAELALVNFAGKVNANSSAVIRADVEATMRAGWTEAQVARRVYPTEADGARRRALVRGF